MTEPTFIDSAQVAQLLDMPSSAFLAKRRDLEDHHDFPLPLPWWKRPLKYRRDQVAAWLSRQGMPGVPEAVDPYEAALTAGVRSGKVALMAEARRP